MRRYPLFLAHTVLAQRLLAQVLVLAFAVLVAPARSQEAGPIGPAKPLASPALASPADTSPAQAADEQPPMSIFNDQVRRFKFLLEHDVASAETAEMFSQRYQNKNNPRIIGVYPDARTNSLVVIGPPEAEQAIRENLAEWLVESQGLGPALALVMQLRILQHERTKLLQYMAETEVVKVKTASREDEKAKVPHLADRLESFERELKTVEEQIQVVRKYMDRLVQDDPAKSGDAAGSGR